MATDLLLVSDSLCLGSLELGLLDVQEVLHTQLASMLTTLWHNICNQEDNFWFAYAQAALLRVLQQLCNTFNLPRPSLLNHRALHQVALWHKTEYSTYVSCRNHVCLIPTRFCSRKQHHKAYLPV